MKTEIKKSDCIDDEQSALGVSVSITMDEYNRLKNGGINADDLLKKEALNELSECSNTLIKHLDSIPLILSEHHTPTIGCSIKIIFEK